MTTASVNVNAIDNLKGKTSQITSATEPEAKLGNVS